MSNEPKLTFKTSIANAPIYKGGNSTEMIRRRYGLTDIVKLSSNENPFPTSAVVQQTLHDLIDGLNRYPPMGDDDLRAALADYIGCKTTAEHFITGNGGCDVLMMIATAFLTPEDEAIICPPTFPVYELTIDRIGATAVHAPLNDDYTVNVDRILAAVTDKTRLLYLCSPNNPTGSYLSQAQLDRLLAELPDYVLIVADEVYHHFVTADDYADSFAPLHNDRNVIIVHSFSKVFGLAGLRLGYGIARPEIAQYVTRARLPFHINRLTMFGGVAGLGDRTHLAQTVETVVNGREWLYEKMQKLDGVQVWPSQSNFLLFKVPYDGPQTAEQLQQSGTIVRELGGFYMPGFLRVSVGLKHENERFITDLTTLLSAASV